VLIWSTRNRPEQIVAYCAVSDANRKSIAHPRPTLSYNEDSD
jgi:hypothetical protein